MNREALYLALAVRGITSLDIMSEEDEYEQWEEYYEYILNH